jgi:signal peptidase I
LLFIVALGLVGLVGIVAIGLIINVLALKLAALIFRRPKLRWRTAGMITCVVLALSGIGVFLEYCGSILGVPASVETSLQLLSTIVIWWIPTLLIHRSLDLKYLRSFGLLFFATIIWGVLFIGFAISIRVFAFEPFLIPSGAMLPTIKIGDQVVANKLVYRIREPARGDIVLFKSPLDRHQYVIRRVIAVGGETIEIRDNRVFVNDKPIDDPWGHHLAPQAIPQSVNDGGNHENLAPIVLPPNTYFLLGDNRGQSRDSRDWGPIKREDIKGKPSVIFWSEDRDAGGIRWERIGKNLDEVTQKDNG